MEHIVIAGKLKDRNKWSIEDDDNHILPCPLKVYINYFIKNNNYNYYYLTILKHY